MRQEDRSAPLPVEMQGRRIGIDNPSEELIVEGGEITCFGSRVDYDCKQIRREHGALTVDLGIEDPAEEDDFHRRNITGLVITPEGEFHVYNVRFACQFVRAQS